MSEANATTTAQVKIFVQTFLRGPVVSICAFYSNDASSNPAGYFNFLCKERKIIEKQAGVGPSLIKLIQNLQVFVASLSEIQT